MSSNCIILMYHVVDVFSDKREQRLCCSPESFREQMQYLSETGYKVISLGELPAYMKDKKHWGQKTAVITFDDGTACTYENAFPILNDYGFTATVFVISDLVGGYNEWLHEKGFPKRSMLSVSQMLELNNGGIDIGSHTATHCKLGEVSAERSTAEINDSKMKLEDMLGMEVPHFAYPFGSYNKHARDVVEDSGYKIACTTQPGRNNSDSDVFLLKRVEIKGQDSMWQFRMKLLCATHDMPPYSIVKKIARKGLEKTGIISPRKINKI